MPFGFYTPAFRPKAKNDLPVLAGLLAYFLLVVLVGRLLVATLLVA